MLDETSSTTSASDAFTSESILIVDFPTIAIDIIFRAVFGFYRCFIRVKDSCLCIDCFCKYVPLA